MDQLAKEATTSEVKIDTFNNYTRLLSTAKQDPRKQVKLQWLEV